MGAVRVRRGELLEEPTTEEGRRTKSVLAACVLHCNEVEAGAFSIASAHEAPHFQVALYARGWIPMPVLALHTGVLSQALVPLFVQRNDAGELTQGAIG